MAYSLENPFPTSINEFDAFFDIEIDHMPSKTYFQNLTSKTTSHVSVRNEIVSSIVHYSRRIDPFISYLAVTYMDRFLSTQSFQDWKPWMFKLVAVSCISLALKMRKSVFFFSDIMYDGGLTFDSNTIKRMEMLILGALNWRMRSVTPFSFTDYFLSYFESDDVSSFHSLKDEAIEIYMKGQSDIKLLEFNPSIISASALLAAAYDMFPRQFPSFMDSICSCPYVDKGNLKRCYDVMRENVAEWSTNIREELSESITYSESNQMSENGKSGNGITMGANNSLQLSQAHNH